MIADAPIIGRLKSVAAAPARTQLGERVGLDQARSDTSDVWVSGAISSISTR